MAHTEKIKKLREARGLSQQELASELGVSLASIKNWESNKTRIKLSNALKVVKYFGIKMDYLVFE